MLNTEHVQTVVIDYVDYEIYEENNNYYIGYFDHNNEVFTPVISIPKKVGIKKLIETFTAYIK